MSSRVFKFFNPQGPKEDPVQRRRGQLRRAQQNYRARKDKYTKSLEEQFGESRARETLLKLECERLQGTVQALTQLLAAHGIQAPAELYWDDGHAGAYTSFLNTPVDSPPSTRKDTLSPPESSGIPETPISAASWNDTHTQSAGVSPSYGGTNLLPTKQQRSNRQLASPQSLMEYCSSPKSLADSNTNLGNLDQVTVGMEFVLALEQPCLGHIHGNPEKPEEPNGHAFTVSAQVLAMDSCLLSHPSVDPQTQKDSAAMLNRLLDLSPELASTEEATPAQMWALIHRQPQYSRMQLRDLRTLATSLREAVKCHGFGAVVELGIFNRLLASSQAFS